MKKLTLIFTMLGIICAIALLYISGLRVFGTKENKQESNQTISHTVDTLYISDTSKHTSITNHFNTTNAYTVQPTGKIDTNEIIRNYFTKRFVADSTQDSIIKISIYDSLFNNQITYRKRTYKLLKPYQMKIYDSVKIINDKFHTGLYVGPFVNASKSAIYGAGVEANYVTEKYNYGLGYDAKNNSILAKFLFKINAK